MVATKEDVSSAILAVMKTVGYVQRTGEMRSGGRYSYPTEGDLIRALRPALVENNLLIMPTHYELLVSDKYQSSGNNLMHRVLIKATFTIHHQPSATSVEVEVFGEGTDVGDKALYKAMTGALKYALRQPFIIETGDDPDNVSSEAQEESAEKKTTAAKTTSRQSTAKKETKAAAEPGFDSEMMNKAMAYTVPPGMPQAGKQLSKLISLAPMGVIVISFLSGNAPDGNGNMFKPTNEEEEKLMSAAAYIYDKNPEFQKAKEAYAASVK